MLWLIVIFLSVKSCTSMDNYINLKIKNKINSTYNETEFNYTNKFIVKSTRTRIYI